MTLKSIFLVGLVLAGLALINTYRTKNSSFAQSKNLDAQPHGSEKVALVERKLSSLDKSHGGVVAPLKLPDSRPALDKRVIFTKDARVHLNLKALFLKNKAFQELNPGLTLEKILAGDIPLESIKLPAGTKLSYMVDSSCENQQNELLMAPPLNLKERSNFKFGAPAFISQTVATATDVQSLANKIATNPCIKDVAFNDTNPATIKAEGSQDPSNEKAAADSAIAKALAVDGAKRPVMVVIGTNTEIRQQYADLMPASKYQSHKGSVGAYPLSVTNPDGTTSIQPTVIVQRPLPVLAANGEVSDAALSNAIITAAAHGAKVINISVPNYDPINFQAAITYAVQNGAVVVNKVPVAKRKQ
jgi:hypothetical protein